MAGPRSYTGLGYGPLHPVQWPSFLINGYFMLWFDPYCIGWLRRQLPRTKHDLTDRCAVKSAGFCLLPTPPALHDVDRVARKFISAGGADGDVAVVGASPLPCRLEPDPSHPSHVAYDVPEGVEHLSAYTEFVAAEVAAFVRRNPQLVAAEARSRFQYRINVFPPGSRGPSHRDSHILSFIFSSLPHNSFGVRQATGECLVVLGLAGVDLLRASGTPCCAAPLHHGGHPSAAADAPDRWSLVVFWT